jgi:predicted nucleic acid-binding protein
MSEPRHTSWTEQNRAHLLREFTRLKQILGGNSSSSGAQPAAPAIDSSPATEWLAALLNLTEFERDILLLCAGVEMDSEFAAQCAKLQGAQRARVTFAFASNVLPEAHWSALAPTRPLRRFRLLDMEGGYGLTQSSLQINERVLHYLTGINFLDPRLQPLLHASEPSDWITDEQRQLAQQACEAWESDARVEPVVHFCGDDPNGQEEVADLATRAVGRRLFTLRVDDLVTDQELEDLTVLWEREALLLPGSLLIQCGRGALPQRARRLLERLPGPLAVSSREPIRLERPALRLDLNKPSPAERVSLWRSALGVAAGQLNGAMGDLATQFRLSSRTIRETSSHVQLGGNDSLPQSLWDACRSFARPQLGDLAERVSVCSRWEDLVLPDAQMLVLRQLASQARHRMKVYETWGFSSRGRRGLGVSALFVGESGTGKTMAAEVLARELRLDLYRIDLAAVISKYIGETEKNLKQVFDAAEEGGAVLLFDEADALFGRRTDVKDSHDRYANIEVAYLLQRMESYQGLVVLTTNLKSAIDRAFQRRLRFTVTFPFPDASQREAIWRRIFPADTPTAGLDPRKLSQLNVAGGNIHNIALNAAFLAAESSGPVAMAHLLQAAKLEVQKIERPLSDAEVRGWA